MSKQRQEQGKGACVVVFFKTSIPSSTRAVKMPTTPKVEIYYCKGWEKRRLQQAKNLCKVFAR